MDEPLVFYSDKKSLGFIMLFIFLLPFLAITFLTLRTLIMEPNVLNLIFITPSVVISFVISLLFILVLFYLPSMRYELRDDALYLIIGPWEDRIPYNEILDVSVKDLLLSPLSSFRLPGLALFDVDYSDEGIVRMYSTHALKEVVLIKTLNKKYGISPKDEKGFIEALRSKIKDYEVVKVDTSKEVGVMEKESQTKRFSVVEIIVWLIVLVSFIVGIYLYPRLPQKIAVHWGASGNVNGYLPKFSAIFLIPFLFTLISLIPLVIPEGSSQGSYRRFRFKYYLAMLLVFGILFFAYIYMLLWNIGIKMNFSVFSTILITGIVISIVVQLILFRRVDVSKKVN